MIEYGPHSGDSHNLFGFSCFSRSMACLQPDGLDRPKSFCVHRSAFNFAPCAACVSRDVGEQNTSTKSICRSLLWISMAISVRSSLCHFSFSLTSQRLLAGASGSVGSGAASLLSCCSLPVFQEDPDGKPGSCGQLPQASVQPNAFYFSLFGFWSQLVSVVVE